jgi:hypothetical protein
MRARVMMFVKVVIRAALIAGLSSVILFAVAWSRWEDDWRACDMHWAGSDSGAVACMDARRESRWGPWSALGRTADITYNE